MSRRLSPHTTGPHFAAASVTLVFLAFVSPAAAQLQWVNVNKGESGMTYRLVHPLHKIESTSKEVMFRIQVDPATKEIRGVTGSVDVTTFDSGNSSRDSHAMEVIDAISYPEASFTSTSIVQRGDSLTVSGTMTFHGVTQNVIIPAAVHWTQGRLAVDGSFDLSLTAFKIERPSLLLIPVEDTLSFTFTAVFQVR